MQEILLKIFDNVQEKHIKFKFRAMIHCGLVILNLKYGAIMPIHEKIYDLLRGEGLYIEKHAHYNKRNALVFISKKNPIFMKNEIEKYKNGKSINHKLIGYKLGYLTPEHILTNYPYKKKFRARIQIKFRHNNSEILIANVLCQVAIDKTIQEINSYLNKYIVGIKKLIPLLPEQFKIVDICNIIEELPSKYT